VSGAATTRWSLVLAARGADGAGRDALGELCQNYRPVIFAFFRRHEEPLVAEDRTQAFLLHFLEQGLHSRADAEKGSFRAFLFTSVRNFWHQSLREESAKRRSGGTEVGEDALAQVVADDPDPERQFVRDWALNMFARAQAALQEEANRSGKDELFEAVQPFLFEAPEHGDYDRIGGQLSMPANSVAVAVKRLRERLRAQVQQELADTLAPGSDPAAEMDRLREALRKV
jgi:DNA-directed RNA polymerase specialized sigma24 family protein